MNRRNLVAIITTGCVGLAGCTSGQESNNDETEPESGDDEDDDTGDEESQSGPIVVLEDSAYSESRSSNFVGVEGVIKNEGDTQYPLVTITVTFFEDDIQLGSGTDVVDNFRPGMRYEFDAVAFGVEPARVDRYQISTEP